MFVGLLQILPNAGEYLQDISSLQTFAKDKINQKMISTKVVKRNFQLLFASEYLKGYITDEV